MKTLFRFDSMDNAGQWVIINDGVMGGVSQSGLALVEDGALRFSGTVSLENNGGFASTRAAPRNLGIDEEQGIRLTVRGDGKTYRLRLYTDHRSDVAHEAPFATIAGQWQTVDLPFTDFVPTFRGRVLTDVGPLDPRRVDAVGIMIRDGQAGPFALDVAAIAAYAVGEPDQS